MRFVMLMQPRPVEDEAEWEPSADDVAQMMKYNEELTQAGVLLALDGLRPPSEGARVSFSGGGPSVERGPFRGEQVVGGYWIVDVESTEQAIEWAKRCPAREGDRIEVRRIAELEDFSEEVQAVAQLSQEPPEQTVSR